MNRQQRRASEARKTKGIEPTRVPDVQINVTGLDKLMPALPDDRWYCMKVYFNRGGLMHISQQVNPIHGNPQP